MRKLNKIAIATWIGMAALNGTAQETALVLTPEQSTGGALCTNRLGTLLGVCLNRSCEKNFARKSEARVDWNLSTPLAPGWWHVRVESGFGSGYANRDIAFTFVSDGNPSVPLAENYSSMDEALRSQPFAFWIYTSSTTTAVRLSPLGDLWRYKDTWPVLKITLTKRTPPALTAADAVAVALPIALDGSTTLPAPLPPGNYRISAVLKKRGKDPGCAVLRGMEGGTIQAPFSFDRYGRGPSPAYAFFADPLVSLAVQADYRYDPIVLQHKISRLDPPKALAAEAPVLTKTVDASRIVVEKLELLGEGLTGAPPALALFPYGKKIAVLTSWDDGKPEDMRCAEILNKHGYRPTFFLNNSSPAMSFLDKLEALNVEVGSHAFNHPSLYTLSPASAAEECAAMRRVLEQKLGHPVISFGYPNGYFPAWDVGGDYVLRAVQEAGYWSGRTTGTKQETVDSITNALAMNTDGFFGNAKDLERTWAETQTKDGGVFYFWGHSWQIGKTDEQWNAFEKFVAQFAGRPNAWYCSQGELSLWLWARRNVTLTAVEKNASRMTVNVSRAWLHPYLAERCPLSLQVPAGVEKVVWRGKEIRVTDGYVDLVWPQDNGPAPKGQAWEPAWGFWPDAPAFWHPTHQGMVKQVKKGPANIIFVGDSITKGWAGAGKDIWQERYAPLGAVNIGIGGDTTRQILWRVDNGALDGAKPKLIVLMIGVNNIFTATGSDEDIVRGIGEILKRCQAKCPESKILLLGILPLGNATQNVRVATINRMLKGLQGGSVRFLDMTACYQDAESRILAELYRSDQVHLVEPGYQVWAEIMQPVLEAMLK